MSDKAGWVTVGELPDGCVFEDAAGRRWHRGVFEDAADGHEVSALGSDEWDHLPADAPARPLTPVFVHPALDADARAMLLGALESGEVAPLADFLTERFGDRDLVAAVRANVRKEIAREVIRPQDDGYVRFDIPTDFLALSGYAFPGGGLEPRVWTSPVAAQSEFLADSYCATCERVTDHRFHRLAPDEVVADCSTCGWRWSSRTGRYAPPVTTP